jgi:hypothetical protein
MPRTRLARAVPKSAFLVKINAVDYLFTKAEGGNLRREPGQYVDPTSRTKVSILSTKEYTNVTLSCPWQPDNLAPILAITQQLNNGDLDEVAITIQAIKDDSQLTPLGRPRTLQGCQLVEERYPDVDMESTEAAIYELEFTVDAVDETRTAA